MQLGIVAIATILQKMVDNPIYEATEYECPTLSTLPDNTMSQYHGKAAPSNQPKWFRVIVVLALLLNFLLIIGLGAALFYYQNTEVTKIRQELNRGITSGLSDRNTSGSPELQGEITE